MLSVRITFGAFSLTVAVNTRLVLTKGDYAYDDSCVRYRTF
jgi:hypothetical protein